MAPDDIILQFLVVWWVTRLCWALPSGRGLVGGIREAGSVCICVYTREHERRPRQVCVLCHGHEGQPPPGVCSTPGNMKDSPVRCVFCAMDMKDGLRQVCVLCFGLRLVSSAVFLVAFVLPCGLSTFSRLDQAS